MGAGKVRGGLIVLLEPYVELALRASARSMISVSSLRSFARRWSRVGGFDRELRELGPRPLCKARAARVSCSRRQLVEPHLQGPNAVTNEFRIDAIRDLVPTRGPRRPPQIVIQSAC